MKHAVDVLCECRKTLMQTYIFAFYLRENNQSVMFEANQLDLQKSIEKLSDYLENDIEVEKADLKAIQRTVQDNYR